MIWLSTLGWDWVRLMSRRFLHGRVWSIRKSLLARLHFVDWLQIRPILFISRNIRTHSGLAIQMLTLILPPQYFDKQMTNKLGQFELQSLWRKDIQLSSMKLEGNGLKILKKVDDTHPCPKHKSHKTNKGIAKPKAKRDSKKTLKMLPGQQILSFKPNLIKTTQKTLDFICVDEDTMKWPEEFSNKLITHDYDNDQDSNEHIVKKEVQKGIATLVEEITLKKIMQMEDTIGF